MTLRLRSGNELSKHHKRKASQAPARERNYVIFETSGYGTSTIKAAMSERARKRELKLLCLADGMMEDKYKIPTVIAIRCFISAR